MWFIWQNYKFVQQFVSKVSEFMLSVHGHKRLDDDATG